MEFSTLSFGPPLESWQLADSGWPLARILTLSFGLPFKREAVGFAPREREQGEKETSCGVAAGSSSAPTPQKTLFLPRSRSGMGASPRFRRGVIGSGLSTGNENEGRKEGSVWRPGEAWPPHTTPRSFPLLVPEDHTGIRILTDKSTSVNISIGESSRSRSNQVLFQGYISLGREPSLREGNS